MQCIRCGSERLYKRGRINGESIYQCKCGCQLILLTKKGWGEKGKGLAIRKILMNRIGRIKRVTAPSIMRWLWSFVKKHKNSLEQQQEIQKVRTAEVDEACSYVKEHSARYGHGRYMIVPLTDGSLVLVPIKPSKNRSIE